jgi:hypothetical protein
MRARSLSIVTAIGRQTAAGREVREQTQKKRSLGCAFSGLPRT